MPKQIQKSLQECLSKMKISNKQIQFPIRSCRRTKTASFAADECNENEKRKENDAATLSDVDQFLLENFRSLYQEDSDNDEEEGEEENSKRDQVETAAFLLESPRLLENPPPENLCSSARFFIATGSSSSLIIDEPSSSSSTSSSAANGASSASGLEDAAASAKVSTAAPDDFIALLTYSPSPYDDFRRSMQEMVDARVEHNGRVDWEFLEELLFCYLDLNNKKSYRHILRAFVDLIVVLRESSGRVPAVRPPLRGGGWRKQLN